MNFLHYNFNLTNGDIVEVTLDKQANVRLMDEANYALYKSGKAHKYHGGLVKQSPLRLPTPSPGRWHVVVDLGGYAGTVKASAHVVRG